MAYAAEYSAEKFLVDMRSLREEIGKLPRVEMLPDLGEREILSIGSTRNDYSIGMDSVKNANLVVTVYKYANVDVDLAIQRRCQMCQPMMLFYQHGTLVPKYVSDCLRHHRSESFALSAVGAINLPDPIEFFNEGQITKRVAEWAAKVP